MMKMRTGQWGWQWQQGWGNDCILHSHTCPLGLQLGSQSPCGLPVDSHYSPNKLTEIFCGSQVGLDWDLTGTLVGQFQSPTSIPPQSHSSPTSVLLQFYFSQTLHIFQVLQCSIQNTNMITFCQHQCPFSSLFSSVLFCFFLFSSWASMTHSVCRKSNESRNNSTQTWLKST